MKTHFCGGKIECSDEQEENSKMFPQFQYQARLPFIYLFFFPVRISFLTLNWVTWDPRSPGTSFFHLRIHPHMSPVFAIVPLYGHGNFYLRISGHEECALLSLSRSDRTLWGLRVGEGQLFGFPEVGMLLLPGLPKLADPVSYATFPVEKLRHAPLGSLLGHLPNPYL